MITNIDICVRCNQEHYDTPIIINGESYCLLCALQASSEPLEITIQQPDE